MAALEEKVKADIEKDKEELAELEEPEEETSDSKWKVGRVSIQTEPVIICEDKTYSIYGALAELLNRTEED